MWTAPHSRRAPVRFVDIGARTRGAEGREIWLPGLDVDDYGDHAVCAGPMGVGIAWGEALTKDVVRAEHGAEIGRASSAACREVGALTGASTLPEARARAWAALRVSPARGEEVLSQAARYAVRVEETPQGAMRRGLETLEEALATLGFRRADGEDGAWPLAFGTPARHGPAGRDRAHPEWASVIASPMGWIAVGGSTRAREGGARGPCPECVRLHGLSSPWGEILEKVPHLRVGRRAPSEATQRAPEADLKGCAALIARALAREEAQATLRWWPCDEPYARAEEVMPRHARCTRCARGEAQGESASIWERLETVAERTGPWTGWIAELVEHNDDVIHDGTWGWTTLVTRTARTQSADPESRLGGRRSTACGKGTSPGGARASALGEFVERECLRWHEGAHETERASVRELKERSLRFHAPDVLARYSAQQLEGRDALRAKGYHHVRVPAPFGKAEEAAPLRWMKGTDVLAGAGDDTVRVPLSWTCIGAPPDQHPSRPGAHPEERYFCMADSNGCAAGPTWEDAVARAFCEVVERDAFAIWWYNQIVRPGVDTERLDDPWIGQARERFERAGRDIAVLDLTLFEDLPVVACIGRNSARRRAQIGEDITVTSGCGPSLLTAAQRAVAEQAQMAAHGRARLSPYYARRKGPDYQAIGGWTIEAEPWLAPDPNARLRTAADHKAHRTLHGHAFLEIARNVAREAGTAMTAVDLTRAEFDIPVAKVAAPGLCHFWHRFGAERLRRAPVESGWTREMKSEQALNAVPVVL